ncbi:hypothetical protein EMPG_17888 [Blastomyces silverae]|uniref:Uncharacterized protein n=1 Tax=Blastomyces silverae TaxID=2060906 RepID=A0A0H1B6I2_9EURO|nr:hypothetical protein EMPG_17888 [Blastomyces silverae]
MKRQNLSSFLLYPKPSNQCQKVRRSKKWRGTGADSSIITTLASPVVLDLFRAIGTPSHTLRSQTIDAASHPWEYAEIKSTLAINEEQKSADADMQAFRDHFNCNADGWVPAGIYDEARRKVDEMKAHMLQIAETEEERQDIEEGWPFQDQEEEF